MTHHHDHQQRGHSFFLNKTLGHSLLLRHTRSPTQGESLSEFWCCREVTVPNVEKRMYLQAIKLFLQIRITTYQCGDQQPSVIFNHLRKQRCQTAWSSSVSPSSEPSGTTHCLQNSELDTAGPPSVVSPSSSCFWGWRCSHPPHSSPQSSDSVHCTPWRSALPHSTAPSRSQCTSCGCVQ